MCEAEENGNETGKGVGMKIAIISASDSGGGGIAALRLHKALMAYGVDSSMLCLYKSTDTPKVYEYKKSFLAKAIDHLPFISYRQNKYKRYYKELSSNYTCFSFPEAIFDISDHPIIQQADIINLHWVGNMLNYPRFFTKVKKPIVWTLHDNNPFQGIAHYRCERTLYEQFRDLENQVCELKSNAINQHPDISVVNLCNWMKIEAEKSKAFANRPHVIIPNSIDISVFRVYDKVAVRKDLGLPVDKPILLFVSQSVENRWKGFDILKSAIMLLDRDCFLLIVGEANDNLDVPCEKMFMGTINDEQLMAYLYAAADAFILPTLEDNLPNTMVESLCCGTPVITFSNGGMTDYIKNMKNGIIVKDPNSDDLLQAINIFLDNMLQFDDRKMISHDNHEKFSPRLQAKRYVELYKSILER